MGSCAGVDPGDVARADLRNYALRRCIRFYTAVILAALALATTHQAIDPADSDEIASGIAVLFCVLAVVEVASGVVVLEMARVRGQHPGPETPLWRFAQVPHPSWLAAALFAATAAFMAWA